MKAPSPLFILLFSIALIYRGFVAFNPSLRAENKKNRKPIPKLYGIVYFFFGLSGVVYSLYVIYVFAGGAVRLLPVDDKVLFLSSDLLLFAPIAFSFVLYFIVSIWENLFPNKKKKKED